MAIGKLTADALAAKEQRDTKLANVLLSTAQPSTDETPAPRFNQPPPPDDPDDEDGISEDQAAAKKRLMTLTLALPDVAPDNLSEHLKKIQIARLQWLLISEMESHEASPQTQRELNSLNKMVTGKDLPGETNGETDGDRADRAKKLLTDKFGMDEQGAARTMRALESVMSLGPRTDDAPSH